MQERTAQNTAICRTQIRHVCEHMHARTGRRCLRVCGPSRQARMAAARVAVVHTYAV